MNNTPIVSLEKNKGTDVPTAPIDYWRGVVDAAVVFHNQDEMKPTECTRWWVDKNDDNQPRIVFDWETSEVITHHGDGYYTPDAHELVRKTEDMTITPETTLSDISFFVHEILFEIAQDQSNL